ncbi:predicted protein [Chaetoceros tenuissimus]|uniref:Uncharacterized protein n=1 Tax=Chaetoceros tenuissimus TaxID=426638 RepID=A0AAD3D7K3_9STRA|nr:predicted protein [Chaetoceros tenuissimus]
MGDEENNVAVVNAECDPFADGWHGDGCCAYYCFKAYKSYNGLFSAYGANLCEVMRGETTELLTPSEATRRQN